MTVKFEPLDLGEIDSAFLDYRDQLLRQIAEVYAGTGGRAQLQFDAHHQAWTYAGPRAIRLETGGNHGDALPITLPTHRK